MKLFAALCDDMCLLWLYGLMKHWSLIVHVLDSLIPVDNTGCCLSLRTSIFSSPCPVLILAVVP